MSERAVTQEEAEYQTALKNVHDSLDAIQNAKDGGGTVIIENHSSASTGGQVAGAGQTVTDGEGNASSHTETRINAGNDGGTVQVKIETSRNGETEKEEYTKEIEPGKPVEVNVSAKVDSTLPSRPRRLPAPS